MRKIHLRESDKKDISNQHQDIDRNMFLFLLRRIKIEERELIAIDVVNNLIIEVVIKNSDGKITTPKEAQEKIDDAKNLEESEYEAFSAYINNGMDWDIDNFRDAYIGYFEGFNLNEEFGQHILEEMGELEQVPQHLRFYIDAESYGRDLLMSDFFESDGYIFRNC